MIAHASLAGAVAVVCLALLLGAGCELTVGCAAPISAPSPIGGTAR